MSAEYSEKTQEFEAVHPSDTKVRLAKSTFAMTVGTMLSRLTGLLRTWAMAYALGTTFVASSYQISNNLPNTIYEFIAGGMIAAAFLPVLMYVKNNYGKKAANIYSSNILNIAGVVLLLVSVLCMFFAEPIVLTQTFTVGSDSEVFVTAVWLFRIFAIQILLYGLSGIVQGMLNAKRSFFRSAVVPMFNNIVVIVSLIAYSVLFSNDQTIALGVLAVGTTLGVFIQFVCQLPALVKMGFKWKPVFNLKDPMLKETMLIAVPTILYVMTQIVMVSCRNAFALQASDSGPAMLAYAWLWFQLPYGVIAVSIARTMFTEMSDTASKDDMESFRYFVAEGLRKTFMLIIPCAVCLIALAVPLISLFQVGAFDSTKVNEIASLLAIWAVGLPFYSMVMYLYNAFAALRRFKSFALMNIVFVAIQCGLYAVLTPFIGIKSIPVADVIYYMLYGFASLVLLRKYAGNLGMKKLIMPIIKVCVASAISLVAMRFFVAILPSPKSLVNAIIIICIAGTVGLFLILALANLFGIDEIRIITAKLRSCIAGKKDNSTEPEKKIAKTENKKNENMNEDKAGKTNPSSKTENIKEKKLGKLTRAKAEAMKNENVFDLDQ